MEKNSKMDHEAKTCIWRELMLIDGEWKGSAKGGFIPVGNPS